MRIREYLPTRRWTAVATCLALAAGVISTVATGPGRVDADSNFPMVGQMATSPNMWHGPGKGGQSGDNFISEQSSLYMDPAARRAYQLVGIQTKSNGYSAEVTVFDLDTLKMLKVHIFNGISPLIYTQDTTDAPNQDFVSAFQPGPHPRLFFIDTPSNAATPAWSLVTINLDDMSSKSVPVQGTSNQCSTPFPSTCPVWGISYDARSGYVYALEADSAVVFETTFIDYAMSVQAIDPQSGPVTGGRLTLPATCSWRPTDADGAAMDQAPLFRSTDGNTLWTACNISPNESGGIVSAVAVPLNAQAIPTGSPIVYPSINGVEDVFPDPPSDRLYFRARNNGGGNFLAFDGRRGAYVGIAALDQWDGTNSSAFGTGNGVDVTTGRYYYASTHGLYLIDGRRTDPSGFPQAYYIQPEAPWRYGSRDIIVDPVTRHVFILWGNGDPTKQPSMNDQTYTVYQDNIPVSQDIPESSQDKNTEDIPEGPSTVSIYEGHAQGFGARTFSVNPPNISAVNESTGPVGGTRDLLYGSGTAIDVSNNTTSAVGTSFGADSQTRQAWSSATNPSPPSPAPTPPPGASAPPYPYPGVACHDTTGQTQDNTETNPGPTGGSPPAGSATASCNLTEHDAQLSSRFFGPAAGANGASLDFASSTFTSDVNVNPAYSTSAGKVSAIVSTATATVRGIHLPGVSIDSVSITATSVAGGRHGTASTSVTRTLSGVIAGTFQCGTASSSPCVTADALKQINLELQTEAPGQFQVVIPAADQEDGAGTPHGYFAAALKDRYQYLNDTVVNLDFRPEIVGLEIVRSNDAVFLGQQARQVTDLGGVEVESRYGITPQATFPTDDGSGGGDTSSGGDVVGGLTNPGLPTTVPPPPAGSPRPGNGGPSGFAAVVQSVLNGLAAFADIHQLPLMATVWSIFMFPGYLATRRRRLERVGL